MNRRDLIGAALNGNPERAVQERGWPFTNF